MAYLHGYNEKESTRLNQQANTLFDMIYSGLDFSKVESMLEIGCGTGEQTTILLEHNPKLKLVSVDHEAHQIEVATNRIEAIGMSDRVDFKLGNAEKLDLKDDQFDAVFICWVLEHVEDPVLVLSEALRVLKPGGKIYLTEVFNKALEIQPNCLAIMNYWQAFNKFQSESGGDPNVGVKLGSYLAQAGFVKIETKTLLQHHDARDLDKKANFLNYWKELMLSAQDNLIEDKQIDNELVALVKSEFNLLHEDPNSIFFYTPIRAIAEKGK